MNNTGFRRADGMNYRRFFQRLHKQRLFDWYLEVGCRSGSIFRGVRGKTIAVDPFFRIVGDVMGEKPQLHICQKTSDEFFAESFLQANDIQLSMSFLDGMHLFEFLLRDFMNAERFSKEGGVIAMHDCCPFSHEMCTRDLDNLPRGAWTGDVWKLLPILRKWRPDLRVDVLNCRPTGLVIVSGLDPTSRALFENYDAIVETWRDVTLEEWGLEKFHDVFAFAEAGRFLRHTDVFDSITIDRARHDVPEFVTP